MSQYSIDRILYDAQVCNPRDAQTSNTVCAVAVTEETNGWGLWVACTNVGDSPDERVCTWRFDTMYPLRNEAIERAVARVKQARG